ESSLRSESKHPELKFSQICLTL
ncbi:MAG: hypothetical protein JWN04_3207, partial [Myxococcaceae bacterium]|nr:hypothetical protein [Myxococcaceae bacterium]